ncbi:MAG: LON peptidase substrate-binding domain-containing protein [Xenococcaceae cyanobacterium]
MASSSSVAVRELPLFPLPEVVLFPNRPLPLYIFEFRYRIMMNTILESDRCFGVLTIDPATGEIANFGCSAEIIKFQRLADDRMKMLTLGKQRFRLLEYVREKPYRVGLVEWVEDEPTQEDLNPMATKLETLLRNVVSLSAKLNNQKIDLPDDLPSSPIELSYWIASTLLRLPASERQELLEMQNTAARLEKESEILTSTLNHLVAWTALKDALE